MAFSVCPNAVEHVTIQWGFRGTSRAYSLRAVMTCYPALDNIHHARRKPVSNKAVKIFMNEPYQ
jgi:hypothetical protein